MPKPEDHKKPGEKSDTDNETGKEQEDAFTQADVDRIVADRLKREREQVKSKYADYDDLKKKAEGSKSADEKIAELEQQITKANTEALQRRIQAKYGISDEDADLFLTASDEETLETAAKRLAERDADSKKSGNTSPRAGRSPQKQSTDPKREFLRSLRDED